MREIRYTDYGCPKTTEKKIQILENIVQGRSQGPLTLGKIWSKALTYRSNKLRAVSIKNYEINRKVQIIRGNPNGFSCFSVRRTGTLLVFHMGFSCQRSHFGNIK